MGYVSKQMLAKAFGWIVFIIWTPFYVVAALFVISLGLIAGFMLCVSAIAMMIFTGINEIIEMIKDSIERNINEDST